MSRIGELFNRKSKNILSVYYTAGFPRLDATLEIMRALQDHGADMIELGMPYSDPLADGPVIQRSNQLALQNGIRISELFRQLENFRADGITLPVVLMGYFNPILQYGFEKFCDQASAVGVDGLIIPDLPEYEFEEIYAPALKARGLDFIFLITPETGAERVRKLDGLSTGFLYAVSASATTGKNADRERVREYLLKLKSMDLKNPVLVGFGIGDRPGFEAACQFARGAIIGSAFIKALENNPDVKVATKSFLSSILG